MKRINVILLPLLMLLTEACGLSRGDRDVESALVRADAVMETRPDSALAILDSIAPDAIRSDALRARYAVGLYHARFKNYEETSDDSLIALAVNYYDGRHGCRRELMLAHYFQARAMYNAGRYSAATYTAMLAADEAAGQHAPVWEARANDLLAELCHSTYNIEEEILYLVKSDSLYTCTDSVRNALCCRIELAAAYGNIDRAKDGISVLNGMFKRIEPSDTLILGYAHAKYTNLYLMLGETDSAERHLNDALRFGFLNSNISDLALRARLAILKGDRDTAKKLISYLHEFQKGKDPIWVLEPKKDLYVLEGDFKSAYKVLDSLYHGQNHHIRTLMRQSAIVAQRDFMQEKAARNLDAAENARVVVLMIVICIFIAGLALALYWRQRNIGNNLKIQAALDDIRTLNEKLDGNNLVLRNVLLEWRCSLDKVLNSKSGLYEELSPKDIRKILGALSSEEYLDNVTKAIDIDSEGLVSRFRELLPEVRKRDVYVFALYLSGYSTATISTMVGVSLSNLYVIKVRIKERLQSVAGTEKDVLLKFLSK